MNKTDAVERKNSSSYIFTSESVTEGHPDKVCDYIADSKQFSEASFQYDNVHDLGFTVVDYYARFTNNPAEDVLVEIVFREINGETFVENILFNCRGEYY